MTADTYRDMTCPGCGTLIVPKERKLVRPKKTQRYSDCVYICPNLDCGLGLSNAKIEYNRRKIHREKERNVPVEVRDGLDDVLSRSLNEGNRTSKAERFAFDSSEDAITWTVFRYLQNRSELSSACGIEDTPKFILYWGAEYPRNSEILRQQLESILTTTLGEDPRRLTEPDVIIVSERSLVFVEVKHQSPNDRQPDYSHFARYLKVGHEFFNTPATVAASGFYELTRNWIVGSLWARDLGKNFRLINLGPPACRSSASKFAALLNADQNRHFEFVAWTEFLNRIAKPLPEWLSKYVEAKRIIGDQPCR